MTPPIGTGTVQCPRIFKYLPFLEHGTLLLLHNLSGTGCLFYNLGSQCWFQCGSGTGSGPSTFSHCGSGFRILKPKTEKNLKQNKIDIFVDQNCNLLILRHPYRTSKLQDR
jgi:hypothetical protein